MWTLFKLLNIICVLVSNYIWFTSLLPMGPVLLILNAAMLACLGFLPVQFKVDVRSGFILLALLAIVVWAIITDTAVMGLVMGAMYLPVLYLIALPREYQSDLLWFVTKWSALLLIPALIIYWLSLFISLPSFGTFLHPNYKPFVNYLFFIKTTYDYGTFERFNAFFLEPGHLGMLCVFLMMANRFDFKKNPWLWVLLISVIFSFSLAGYLLTLAGFALMKVNTIAKGLTLGVLLAGFIIGVQSYSGGDNAVNQLILERLEYDESKGIKGNNRYFNNTDYEFEKAIKSGDYWKGVADKANMELIGGAGFKIYTLKYGLIGILIVMAFYISLIPPHPNLHFTLSFLFLIILCFVQNAYPGWYSWLLPYVLGLNLNSADSSGGELQNAYIKSDSGS